MAVRVAAKSSEIQILCGILKLFLDLRRVYYIHTEIFSQFSS